MVCVRPLVRAAEGASKSSPVVVGVWQPPGIVEGALKIFPILVIGKQPLMAVEEASKLPCWDDP